MQDKSSKEKREEKMLDEKSKGSKKFYENKCGIINRIIIVLITLAILSACGSNVEETPSNRESRETAEDTWIEEVVEESDEEEIETEEVTEENPELEEIGQIFLEDVTWEDFDDGVGDPIIHFSFSNGTIVDKELLYLSIVQSIEYKDITGDGRDEVIVYRDFLNNACDDYILMDFFEIEDDKVTEISPSTDIMELSNIAWDTETVNDTTEGYSIVLEMINYGKVWGYLYTNAVMTVGYGKEGWEVIEQQKIPEWKLAYLDYLVLNTDADMADNWTFWLAYVDEDEIPELFYYADNVQFVVSLLTYVNGQVKEMGELGGQGAALWYQEKTGKLLGLGAMMGNSSLTAYYFQDGELEVAANAHTNIPLDGDESQPSWYWKGEEVSEEEYEKRSDAVIEEMTHDLDFENGMSFDELWGILGSVDE